MEGYEEISQKKDWLVNYNQRNKLKLDDTIISSKSKLSVQPPLLEGEKIISRNMCLRIGIRAKPQFNWYYLDSPRRGVLHIETINCVKLNKLSYFIHE